MVSDLGSVGINPIRFNAVDVKSLTLEQFLSAQVSKMCADLCATLLAIGLSHINLNKQILKYDDKKYALILEDDMKVAFTNAQEIPNLVDEAPKDWQVLLLHCFGKCRTNNIWETGTFPHSAAAYIVNKKGQEVMAGLFLDNHVDIIRNLAFDVVNIFPQNMFKQDMQYFWGSNKIRRQRYLNVLFQAVIVLIADPLTGFDVLPSVNEEYQDLNSAPFLRIHGSLYGPYDLMSFLFSLCIAKVLFAAFRDFTHRYDGKPLSARWRGFGWIALDSSLELATYFGIVICLVGMILVQPLSYSLFVTVIMFFGAQLLWRVFHPFSVLIVICIQWFVSLVFRFDVFRFLTRPVFYGLP